MTNYLTEDRRKTLAKIVAGMFLVTAVLAASAGTGSAIAQGGFDDAPGTEVEHGVEIENEVEHGPEVEVEAVAQRGADDAPGGEVENEVEHGPEIEFEAIG